MVDALLSVERINVPGADRSGFILLSSVGPLLENAAIPSELSAAWSVLTGAVEKFVPQSSPHSSADVPQP